MSFLPEHLTPEIWLEQLLSSGEARKGGVVKRQIRDVERLVGRDAFLAEAEERGATIVDGLGMLLHQAAPGFERWFGPTPAVDEATRQAVLSA